jgi:PucR family transcriptional regulator, purine catabolism regulatory protein
VSRDLRVMQRLSSIQLQLMDALAEENPERAVLARLASFVDATAILFGPDGTVEAATGDAPTDAIWQAISMHPAVLVEFTLDSLHTVATPVTSTRAVGGWLVVTSRRPRADRLTRPAVRATAPVLSALRHIRGAAREQDRAIRGALLEQALAPQSGREAVTLAARAASLGIDMSAPVRVVLIRPHSDRRNRPNLPEVCGRLEQRLEAAGLRHLLSRRASAIVALIQGDGTRVHAVIAQLIDEEHGAAAGIGRPLARLEAIGHSLRDAEIAVQRVVQQGDGRLLDYAHFDLGTLLVSEAPAERVAPKVEELFGLLRSHPGLHAALVCYFRNDLDIKRTAAAMHMHHNTLRYRLARVEELMGRSLKNPATIAALYIGFAYDEPSEGGAPR